MKKKCLAAFVAAAASLLGACKSTPVDEQENVNLSFETVYNKYENKLILDGATDYVVVPGDTLTRISRSKYGVGKGYYFPLIMLASNDAVQDPDLIEPGMHLAIPDLQRNLEDSGARQAMKDFFIEIADVYERKSTSEERTVLRNLAVQTRQGLLDLATEL
ncbi:MAG: LysM peptidoglycan-binding domain-containing protein [Treponema sp.]|jgi:LysM repeat protein|nr:LysM peptidoglycan-binding domain-containing protein [Treponema sp.]